MAVALKSHTWQLSLCEIIEESRTESEALHRVKIIETVCETAGQIPNDSCDFLMTDCRADVMRSRCRRRLYGKSEIGKSA